MQAPDARPEAHPVSGEQTRAVSQSRRRRRAIRVYVDDAESAAIEAGAATVRLSASNYLRALGLGYEPTSALDHQAVRELAKVAGDQGRLGGLLKQWLSERPGEGGSEQRVATLLSEVLALQAQLRDKVRSL